MAYKKCSKCGCEMSYAEVKSIKKAADRRQELARCPSCGKTFGAESCFVNTVTYLFVIGIVIGLIAKACGAN